MTMIMNNETLGSTSTCGSFLPAPTPIISRQRSVFCFIGRYDQNAQTLMCGFIFCIPSHKPLLTLHCHRILLYSSTYFVNVQPWPVISQLKNCNDGISANSIPTLYHDSLILIIGNYIFCPSFIQ